MSDFAKRSTRRQFLRGKSAADALEDLGRSLSPGEGSSGSEDPSAANPQTYVVQVSRKAMACQFAVFLNAGEDQTATEQAVAALDLVSQLEDQLSVYRHRSEVSRLNASAANARLRVESRLFHLLHQAVQLHAATEGAFDITAGPLIKAWGFYHREGKLPSDEAIQDALQRVGSQWLELDPHQETVFFAQSGLEINLGAIGKGYALDRCAEVLHSAQIENFMIHGGHSTILARGQRLRGESSAGWTVGLRHPLRSDRRLAEVRLQDRALATSGSGTQHFYSQGRRYGHILDPRTGRPADQVLSATVLAPQATVADALSTAFYVMGREKSREYCENHAEVAALLSCPGPRTGTLEVHCFGLDDDDWQRISD